MLSQLKVELLTDSCHAEKPWTCSERFPTHLDIAHYLNSSLPARFSFSPGPPSSGVFPSLLPSGTSSPCILCAGRSQGRLFPRTGAQFWSSWSWSCGLCHRRCCTRTTGTTPSAHSRWLRGTTQKNDTKTPWDLNTGTRDTQMWLVNLYTPTTRTLLEPPICNCLEAACQNFLSPFPAEVLLETLSHFFFKSAAGRSLKLQSTYK